MALYIKDATVDSLAERYQAAIKAKTKTEAVRQALEKALKGDAEPDDYVERAIAWARDFNARTKHNETEYDEKAFIDSLYEDD
jgi:antitoxin VapB